MSQQVRSWLSELGLSQYDRQFADHDVDFETLQHLTADDLVQIGIASIGHRRRVLHAISKLSGPQKGPDNSENGVGERLERRHLTVAFCDMVGSTALSRRCDPEQMSDMFREFFSVMTDVVARFGGHEANRLGDGSLLYFGFPRGLEDAAVRAVLASEALCKEMSDRVRDPHGDRVEVRVGLASGVVVLNRSDEKNAFGDTLNIAARIEGLAPVGGIVLAESTAQLVRPHFGLVEAGEHALKGISGLTPLWRLESDRSYADPLRRPQLNRFTAGRTVELAELQQHWDDTRDSSGRVVAVVGEPGIGKSHLLATFADLVTRDGVTLRRYNCSPYHVDVPFHPLIRELSAEADPNQEEVSLIEAIGETDAGQPKAPLRERRDALVDGFCRRATRGGQLGHLVLVEGLDTADQSSLEAFRQMAQSCRDSSILMLVTARSHGAVDSLEPEDVISVGPLSVDEAAQIVARRAGLDDAVDLDEAEVRSAAERSDGVPIFAQELGSALGAMSLEAEAASEQVQIPETLRDGLEARIDRLEAGAALLRIAAAIGREAPLELLGNLVTDDGQFAAGCTELLAAKMVSEEINGSVFGGPCLVFRHQLTLDCVYDALLTKERVELHGRIADALLQDGDTEAHLVAYQLEKAERHEEASRWWVLAGHSASSRFGEAEAAAHYERALALVPQYESEEQAAEFEAEVLLAYLPSLLGSKGYVEDATISVDRVVQLTRRRNDPEQAFKALFLRWLSLLAKGTVDVAHHFSENLRGLVKQCDSEVADLMHHRMLGTTHMFRGEHDAASAALEYFEEHYDETAHGLAMSEFGATDNYSTVQCCRICIASLRGDALLSSDLQEATAVNAALLGLPHNRCHVLAYGGACAAALVGDWPTMVAYSRQLEEIASEHELPFWLATASMYRGIGYVLDGAPRRGQESFDAGVRWFREQGSSFLQPTFRVMYESASAEAGLLGSTASLHALDGQLDDGERWVRPELLRLRGLDAIRSDNAAAGHDFLTNALGLARTQKTAAVVDRIEPDVLATRTSR